MTTLASRPQVTPAPDRPLTVREVPAWLSVCPRTIFRMVKAGAFPPPVRYGKKCCRWFGSEVRRFLDALREGRAAW
jgi:predicted DNA-binding transcriptional regulator AlpA